MLTPLYIWLLENNSKTNGQGWTQTWTQTDGRKRTQTDTKGMDASRHNQTQWTQSNTNRQQQIIRIWQATI